ncbi:MAG: NADH:flavin oxidoreductase/NADH oxidase [Thermoanaerobaculaceae bacterium]|nr:NADH:flavin oxidoreductase/NADH oxidase [Thermoanaerobaculaceae bacterium]TAM44742.1 MAG: NADH:flavin oxidoreductase/NADH oxidase [Acidobacteriota bacterium]
MSVLFSPLTLRGATFRNRVFVSPMCQYSSPDGGVTDWHLVHLGSRAVGGAGLVLTEATAVSPEGRISPGDAGIWSDGLAERFAPIVAFIRKQGAAAGVQLAHAGRKASTAAPWLGGGTLPPAAGGWRPLAPSAVPFADGDPAPAAMTAADLEAVRAQFVAAARRAAAVGFQVVELHAAHGYLLHEFLSPLSNRRDDGYGGSLEGRMRFPLEVAAAVRAAWPEERPLFVRISATDWAAGGWDADEAVQFARRLKEAGVDLVDCSSGGLVANARVPVGPGYQTPFAARIRREAGVASGAVGMITEPAQAEQIVATGEADAVLLARALLRDPYWPLRAAHALGAEGAWPDQYLRARPH